ncbi:hypothetical protein GCM10009810_04630 [Nostocoides vanveenii]|uniref:Uncharacterized protein n=1 Tax=Nostocoides vanveenii TaxID=330835 RepID=A0ABP4W4J5_9MICO
MLETPEAPSRSSAHRAGVRSALTSDQVKPPVPIRMVRATTGVTAGAGALGREGAAIRAGVASDRTFAARGAAAIRAGMRHRTASRSPSSAAARRVAGLTG